MGKIITAIFILFLGILTYFAILNQDYVTIKLTKELGYSIPKVVLVLFSATAGAFVMLFVYTIRDTKRLINNIQTQKRQKRQEKVQSLYSKAIGEIYAGKNEIASDTLKEVLAEDPRDLQSLLRLGELAVKSRDYKGAEGYFKRVLSADPENVEALLKLVDVKEDTGADEEALGYIDDLLDLDPGNKAALYRKRLLLEKGRRWDDLIYLQKEILKNSKPGSETKAEERLITGYYYEFGRSSLESGSIEKAKKSFKTALKYNKDFIPAHLGLAEVMIQEEGSEDAVNYLEKIYQQYKSLIVLARLEDLLLGVGEPSRLIRIYRNSLTERPSDSSLAFFMTKLYYRLEMLDDALEVMEGIDNQSAFPELARIRGAIYLKRGEAEKAAEEFSSGLDKKKLRLPYCCSACGESEDKWSGRCPSCGEWDTYYFNIHGACKVRDT